MVKYTIKVVRQGQQRRYGPTVYEAYVGIEPSYNARPHDDWFKRIFKAVVHDFVEDGEGDWASFRLKEAVRIDDNTMRIRVEQVYLD